MNHLMDTFHALFCYCYDPTHGYGHYYPYITVKLTNQRTTVKNIPYSNTFSSNLENSKKENEFNIESVMVELILKPLIDRLIEIKNEMTNQENLVNSIFF